LNDLYARVKDSKCGFGCDHSNVAITFHITAKTLFGQLKNLSDMAVIYFYMMKTEVIR